MIPFRTKGNPHALAVGMAGTKMGDQVAQIGCADGARLAAIATTVGLSGRTVAIVPDQATADRVEKGARTQGVLIEVEIAPPSHVSLDDESIDLAILDDTGGLFTAMSAAERLAALGEMRRVLRKGGRAMVVGTVAREGLSALFSRGAAPVSADPMPALQVAGLKAPRVLGEREGLRFVEAIKSRTA
jgi:ubiquinone/menaquinone biosynthesis C-methylase UbiE